MRTLRCVYVYSFNRFKFLAEVSTKLQKMHIFRNLRTITQEKNMETTQMISFSSSTFSALFVTFIFVFENSQNSFSCGPHFGPFWSTKYLNLRQKLSILTAYHTFLESRHLEAKKNPYCIQAQYIGTSSWTTPSVNNSVNQFPYNQLE